MSALPAKDHGLLLLELRVAQDPLRLEIRQLLELLELVVHGVARVRRGIGRLLGRRLLLGGRLLLLLLRPTARLAPRHPIGDRRRRTRDHRGTRYAAKKSWHLVSPVLLGRQLYAPAAASSA